MAGLINAIGLTKHYKVSRSLGQMVRREHPVVSAVDGIDLVIGGGESVGLVGNRAAAKPRWVACC